MNFMDFDCGEMKWIETHRLQKDSPIPWKHQKQFSVLTSNYNSCGNEIGYTKQPPHHIIEHLIQWTKLKWAFGKHMFQSIHTTWSHVSHGIIKCMKMSWNSGIQHTSNKPNQNKIRNVESTILVVIYQKLNDLSQTNMASTKSTERNVLCKIA